MSIDFEDRLTPINRQATRGMSRGDEPYDMSPYLEQVTPIPVRHSFYVSSKLPKVTQLVLHGNKIGLLTIMGLSANGRQVVAQCQCGRYVQRPASVIKGSKGQGCSHCSLAADAS
jgi:hypothetical protein